MESGFCFDIKTLFDDYWDVPEFSRVQDGFSLRRLRVLDRRSKDDFTIFRGMLRNRFKEINERTLRRKLNLSIDRSTGQTKRLLGLVLRCGSPAELLRTLDDSFECDERSHRFALVRVLSGCDFVTPFNHGDTPKCCLCGHPTARLEHLLFECAAVPGYRGAQQVPQFLQEILDGAIWNDEIRNLVEHKFLSREWFDLLLFCLGACLKTGSELDLAGGDLELKNTPQCRTVIKITARHLYTVQNLWLTNVLS